MTTTTASSRSDARLVARAKEGDRTALEELIRRHQSWVYNIALRMVWWPQDAEDVTQEVLLKVVTRLTQFKGSSTFRTWVYRIAANHILNMKKRRGELSVHSFEEFGQRLDRCPDAQLPRAGSHPVASEVLVEETKLGCTTGMLLCLDREQRLIFILGALLQVPGKLGAEIVEISPAAFRKKLSRARKDLEHFMNNQCGLVDPSNPCRCAKKTRGLIQAGVVDPTNLRFYGKHLKTVRQVAAGRTRKIEQWLQLFRSQPFHIGPDFGERLSSRIARGLNADPPSPRRDVEPN